MRISLIVAVSSNGVIGRDGGLPWHLSSDLRRFKALTMGHHMVMGRRTWDSVGRALPGRTTIVVTRSTTLELPEGVRRAGSLGEALKLAAEDDEVFITGGAVLYREAMDLADRLYLTRVHAAVDGDTRFEPDLGGWTLLSREDVPAGDRDQYPHSFEVWERGTRPPGG